MGHRFLLVARSARLASKANTRRAYATLSESIRVDAHDVSRFFDAPTPGVSSITLVTSNTWDQWDTIEKNDARPVQSESAHKCANELPAILERLYAIKSISKTTISLDDVLALPIDHSTTSQRFDAERTPTTVLARIGVKCSCEDLGLWSLIGLPTIKITDLCTREALVRAREFGPGTDRWRDFVAENRDPLLESFDYTADFHSRDLIASNELEGKKTWIDLGPFGGGYARIEKMDVDSLSVDFARDLKHNMEYFKQNSWKPGLYEDMKQSKTSVPSVLGDADDDKITTLVLDRPIERIPPNILEKLIRMLRVADDEEVYFMDKTIKKRKKVQGD